MLLDIATLKRPPIAGLVCAALVMCAPAKAIAQEFYAFPVTRLSVGPSVFYAPATTRLNLDATAGLGVAHVDSPLIFGAEFGYSYDARTLNAFNLAGAIGIRGPWVSVTYRPRLLVGSVDDGNAAVYTSFGMRNALMLHFLLDILSLELGPQFMTSPNGSLEHDFHVGIGVNPVTPLFLISDVLDE